MFFSFILKHKYSKIVNDKKYFEEDDFKKKNSNLTRIFLFRKR